MDNPLELSVPVNPEYILAENCFLSSEMLVGHGVAEKKCSVSELVKEGDLLLQFPDISQVDDKNIFKQVIQLGENCYFSRDESEVFSSVRGYPKIQYLLSSKSPVEEIYISVEPLFKIARNHMSAQMSIQPAIADGGSVNTLNIDDLITEAGISFGIDGERYAFIKQCIKENRPEFTTVTIARGKEPSRGEDSYLEFMVDLGPVPGQLFPNGSIDFRERKIFVPVSAGQIVARKIPATGGKVGRNILGAKIPPIPGNDIAVKTVKDASYSSKNGTVTATKDGVLSVVGESIIRVCSKQEILTDIDYSTGHISSRNTVLIHGSVRPGFKVATDGDLEICGAVNSTAISSKANLVIKGGITGKNSTIGALGDADLYFVEQGVVECGNNCIIRRESYYSRIIAGGHIRCKEDSRIVGGELMAAGSITVGNIGSSASQPALLAAGVDGNRMMQYKVLLKEFVELNEKYIQMVQRNKAVAYLRAGRNMKRRIDKKAQEIRRLNMVPGTGIYSKPDDEHPEIVNGKEEYSEKGGVDLRTITIDVHGDIHAGTKLQIGNRALTIEHTIANRRFMLDDTMTIITPSSLRRTM